MAYNDELVKIEMEAFAELYTFTIGAVVNRYTSYHKDINFSIHTYRARTIKRSNFDNKDEITSDRIKITVPLDPLVLSYVGSAPVEEVKVEIRRMFLDGLESNVVLFQGTVINVNLTETFAEVTVEAGTDILKNVFPAFSYQSNCQWMLFDSGCTLLEASFKTTGTVTVSGSNIISATFATKANGFFTMGHARYLNDIRLITNHVGNTITLQVPFDARLTDGKNVDVYPGCDKSKTTCINKFFNYANFTGFIQIPTSNPTVHGFI